MRWLPPARRSAQIIRSARGSGGGFFGTLSGILGGAASIAAFVPGGQLVAAGLTAGSILSGAFAGGSRESSTRISGYTPRALQQLKEIQRGPDRVVVQIISPLTGCYHTTIDFYLMVGNARTLQYTLYIEHPPLDYFVGYKLERHLGQGNPEFHAKRESTRLGPTQIVYLQPGTAEAYKVHCVQQGQREAQFKLVKLQYAQDCSFDFAKYVRS